MFHKVFTTFSLRFHDVFTSFFTTFFTPFVTQFSRRFHDQIGGGGRGGVGPKTECGDLTPPGGRRWCFGDYMPGHWPGVGVGGRSAGFIYYWRFTPPRSEWLKTLTNLTSLKNKTAETLLEVEFG